MPARSPTPRPVGKPKGKSGLPAPIPGEPASLIGTLRRCTRTLTVEDAATLMNCSKKTVYAQINKGLIPTIDLGFDLTRIDAKGWAFYLEKKNPHLKPSVREYMVA